jgi:hypothetical protein
MQPAVLPTIFSPPETRSYKREIYVWIIPLYATTGTVIT